MKECKVAGLLGAACQSMSGCLLSEQSAKELADQQSWTPDQRLSYARVRRDDALKAKGCAKQTELIAQTTQEYNVVFQEVKGNTAKNS